MKTIRNSPSGKLKPLTPPTSILWRPDGTGDVATWSEVMFATDYAGISPSGSALWWTGAAWQDATGVVVP